MYLQTEWDQRIKIWLEELERESPRQWIRRPLWGNGIRSSYGKAWNGLTTAMMSGLNKTMISQMYKNMEKSKNKIVENKDPHGKIKC